MAAVRVLAHVVGSNRRVSTHRGLRRPAGDRVGFELGGRRAKKKVWATARSRAIAAREKGQAEHNLERRWSSGDGHNQVDRLRTNKGEAQRRGRIWVSKQAGQSRARQGSGERREV